MIGRGQTVVPVVPWSIAAMSFLISGPPYVRHGASQ